MPRTSRRSKKIRKGRHESVRKGMGPIIPGDSLERWEYDPGGAGHKPLTDLKDFMALFATHPWVYACVNAIASAIASIPFKILRKGQEIKLDEESGSVAQFLKQPNPHQTWFELMETTMIYLELTGNCFWEEVKQTSAEGAKQLLAVYPLRPDRMKIHPHPKHKIGGYRYVPARGSDIIYAREDITHIKYTNPLDEYWGISPGWAAQNSLALDFYSLAYSKSYFKRGAEPGFVLETDEELGEDAYNRLIDAWLKRHKGVENAHMPAILEEGLKYKAITISHRDMEFVTMRKMSREEIMAAWHVPPMIVGLLEYANYASAREQRKTFWMDNILVKLQRIQEIINANLMPGDLTFKFETEGITAMIEDEQVAAGIMSQMVNHGLMTINEARAKYLNLKKVPWGDVWWAPMGLGPVDSPQHPNQAMGASPPGAQNHNPQETGLEGAAFVPNAPAGAKEEEEEDKDVPEEFKGKRRRSYESHTANLSELELTPFEKLGKAEPDWENPKDVYLWRRWTLWKQLATPDARLLEKEFLALFSAQGEKYLPQITAADWPVPTKEEKAKGYNFAKALPDKISRWLLNIGEDKPRMRSLLTKEAQRMLKKHGRAQLAELGIRVQFDLRDPRVEKWVAKYAADKVSHITEVTRSILQAHLEQAVKNGEDFQDAMGRISRVFKGPVAEFRARRIARTELVTLTNNAKLQAAQQSGVVRRKMWISELLDSTRAEHREIHGKIVPINDPFIVKSRGGADEMSGPGDLDASPENVVNCLCVLDFPPETQEFADLFEENQEKRDSRPPARVVGKTVMLIKDEAGEPIGSNIKLHYEGDKDGNGAHGAPQA